MAKVRSWMTLEQKFAHTSFCQQCAKVDKEGILEVIELLHANYLIKDALFKKLVLWVLDQGLELPPLDQILSQGQKKEEA